MVVPLSVALSCVQPQWLLEVAQHYYDASSIEDPNAKKKMPRAVGAAPGTFDRGSASGTS